MSKLSDRILHNIPIQTQKSIYDFTLQSIIFNIQHILNTRSALGIKAFLAEDAILDNLSFGLPDISSLSMANGVNEKVLGNLITKAIIAFEPRLKSISINLGEYNALKREITIKVSAYLDRDNMVVNFLLNLNTLEFFIDERERQ